MAKTVEHFDSDEWTLWCNARLAAMEGAFGPAGKGVYHAVVPFDLGADAGEA